MAAPRKIAYHGESCRKFWASRSIKPHEGLGGCVLLSLFLTIPVIAAVNPIDPVWEPGLYDDADTDQLVTQTSSLEGMIGLALLVLACPVARACPVDEVTHEHGVPVPGGDTETTPFNESRAEMMLLNLFGILGARMSAMVDHNVKPGPLNHCQVCGSGDLELVMNCGHQPLCDSPLTPDQLNGPETYYPLRQLRCVHCTCTQLDYVVDGSTVYHQNYPYRTGVTRELAAHQESMAADLAKRHALDAQSLVPGRAHALLHYCDIGTSLMPYIAEQPPSLKKAPTVVIEEALNVHDP